MPAGHAARASDRAPWRRRLGALPLLAALAACGGGGADDAATRPPAAPLSAAAALGRRIFSDPTLSASGRMSCASCHDPAHAYAPGDGLAIPLGGPDGTTPGFRAVPSLRYLAATPAFRVERDGTPVGGFDRDGRAATLAEQARRPFLAPHEMADASVAEVAGKLSRAAYAAEFRALFGAGIFTDPEAAFERATFALERFEREDPSFAPFTSRFDDFLAGRGTLSAQEMRGLALFNDPAKGNCASCHLSAGTAGGAPLFTDFTYDNLGVPRNAAIPATADPAYVDLGLCGPDRQDGLAATRPDLCGAFKVPTLRNVATRHAFFHNGRFATLKEALQFYVTRDTDPARWYPTGADGRVDTFDDLPAAYRRNVNTTEAPYDRRPGEAPRLDDTEIDDVIAFLGTLTDADVR